MNKEKIKNVIAISIISLLVLGVVGVSYAYFRLQIEGSGNDIVLDTGDLRLKYTDGKEISLSNAMPGDSVSKTVTVENIGTRDVKYSLYWDELINTIMHYELNYTMECKSYKNYGTSSQVESGTCNKIFGKVPLTESEMTPLSASVQTVDETTSISALIKSKILIESGITHEYTITVSFDNLDYDQSYNMKKSFTGKISVREYSVPTPVYCTFDGELEQGTTFTKGIYTYSYKQGGRFNPMAQGLEWHDMDENGWGVQLNDKTSTTPITEVPCTYINNIPIVNTSSMFAMSKATSIDLSNFNTSNVVYMVGMFIGAYATTLDLSSFDTSKVTNMNGMFNTANASTINVTSFDTSNVTSMASMFGQSSVKNIIGLENFDTSKVTTMVDMFDYTKVTSLNLSSFDTSKVTDMSNMFSNCKSLKSIYVSDKFNVSNVTSSDSMFTDSTNLVGGNGTKYDSSHTDKEYARIDTTDTPGYFTKK